MQRAQRRRNWKYTTISIIHPISLIQSNTRITPKKISNIKAEEKGAKKKDIF